MRREQRSTPEAGAEKEAVKLEVVPAVEGIIHAEIKNCVVIPEGEPPTVAEIMSAATSNEAFIDNETTEEAGDDLFAVQFPGGKQKLLHRDGIEAARRHMLEGDIE